MLRTVLTHVSVSDLTDEHAEQIDALVRDELRFPDRETYSLEHGQKTYRTALVTYKDPVTGEMRYGIYDEDGATRELEDTDDEDEANARYEELVRARAENLGIDHNDEPECFDASDVDGVPVKD
ncbi:hypothetical protein ABT352_33370 [Streptosporangium sp. NPDC000563]|uniref:hypothetical protein n=1 Tax=Streptosporangium sp. NPDC000563 TaxID=3154366 RepID=UPI00331AB766